MCKFTRRSCAVPRSRRFIARWPKPQPQRNFAAALGRPPSGASLVTRRTIGEPRARGTCVVSREGRATCACRNPHCHIGRQTESKYMLYMCGEALRPGARRIRRARAEPLASQARHKFVGHVVSRHSTSSSEPQFQRCAAPSVRALLRRDEPCHRGVTQPIQPHI